MTTEAALVRLAVELGATNVGGPLAPAERSLVSRSLADSPALTKTTVQTYRRQITAGDDPLGVTFCTLREPVERRTDGAVYTPPALVDPMVKWVLDQAPDRVVDAGSGSGRFLAAVVRAVPSTRLVGIDLDPVATLMTRATLAALGATNTRVIQADYTTLKLPRFTGRTAFVGNPPYVRHHQLRPETKAWAQKAAAELGHKFSGLAGLHAYFFLAAAIAGKPGDIGCFVTSAEWLDVNYGSIIRNLILRQLGGEAIHVLEPSSMPFEGATTTAVITNFRIGQQPPSIRMRVVASLDAVGDLATEGHPVARARVADASRWSGLLRTAAAVPEGFVELGELCRVHRGTVTGANQTWVLRHQTDLPPSVLFASVTKARELFAAGTVLADDTQLRRVVDIPTDLDTIAEAEERKAVEKFIRAAKRAGVHKGYVAAHRRAWWSIGLKQPAPILATYMARQVPAFVLNQADARHINIAHGLYPREHLDAHTLDRLAQSLRSGITLSQGRVYAGGLTKFEPKEMERLMIHDPSILRGHEPLTAALDA